MPKLPDAQMRDDNGKPKPRVVAIGDQSRPAPVVNKVQPTTVTISDADKMTLANKLRNSNAFGLDLDSLSARNAKIVAMANPLYERLNHTWERAEEFFKSRGILTPVSMGYSHDECGEDLIGIQRVGGKWRICIGYLHYNSIDQDIAWTPIADCAIEERSQLLSKIPDLFAQLVKSNEELIPRLEKAVLDAEQILNALSGK